VSLEPVILLGFGIAFAAFLLQALVAPSWGIDPVTGQRQIGAIEMAGGVVGALTALAGVVAGARERWRGR